MACFYMCPIHGRVPDTRPEYWGLKLEGNVPAMSGTGENFVGVDIQWAIWGHDFITKAAVKRTRRRMERCVTARGIELT